jgi:signal transduction histidine kinase
LENKSDIKILLVDDREDNLFSIQTVLEKDGYFFRKATSGREALKILLKEFDFTLILMDVQMPDLNGLDTAELIYERERLRHIPIIFVTANDYSEDYIFKGYQAGAVDYIYKPINPDLLRAKVSVFVELYRKNHLLLTHEKQLQSMNLVLEEKVKERTEELSRKNKELENINAELKKVNNDLDNFVYSASHDLKAPMSNIEGLLSTLYESLGEGILQDENIQMIFDLINQSITRFKGTITDLTEITKIQKNLEEDFNSIAIEEAISFVLIGIRDLIESAQAKVSVNSDPEIQLNFSRKNLNSILFNLISNAIKYRSPERKPEINIDIRKDSEFVVLTVQDNGLGFKPEDKTKIFGMFKRLHNHVEGSGIGLYIVKRILENCGGSIDAESTPGQGSKFKVYFSLNPKKALESNLEFENIK